MSKLSAQLTISLILWSLSLIFPFPIFAASINISEAQPAIINDPNQEYQAKVNLSIDASDGTTYYLRGVFYQSGSSNYCGYTWNGSSWFSGPYSSSEGWKNFLPVTISSSSASTILKAKLDPADNGCMNNGSYNFKVQRFTANGSGNFDTQNEQTLTMDIPSPTLIPTDVPTAIPTGKIVSSATTKPQNTPTIYLSPINTKVVTAINSGVTSLSDAKSGKNDSTGTVLGEMEETPDSTSSSDSKKLPANSHNNFLSIFLLIFSGGLLFIGAAAAISYKQMKNNKKSGTSSG